jgi:hypothetical protein
MKMTKTIPALVLGTLLTLSPSAWAHTDEYFESVDAPHGGQLRMVGPYHLELVAKDGELTVYLTDHADNKLSTGGGLGKATVETGQTRTQVSLHPVGDNVLKGSGAFTLTAETVVIVFFRLPDQDGHSARFMPLKPKPNPGEKSQEGAPKSGGGEHHHHHPPKH